MTNTTSLQCRCLFFMLFGLFLEGDSKSHNLCLLRWSILALNSQYQSRLWFFPSSHPHCFFPLFSRTSSLTPPTPLWFWLLVSLLLCSSWSLFVAALIITVHFAMQHWPENFQSELTCPDWVAACLFSPAAPSSGEEQIWQLISHICKHVWSMLIVLEVVESNVATKAMSSTPLPRNPFLHLPLKFAASNWTGQPPLAAPPPLGLPCLF